MMGSEQWLLVGPKILQLFSMCKAGVSIEYNPHIDMYQTVEKYLTDLEEITNDTIENKLECIEADKIIHVRAYPQTPIGFYETYDTDLLRALDTVILSIQTNS